MKKTMLLALLTPVIYLPVYSQTDTLARTDTTPLVQPAPLSAPVPDKERKEPVYKINAAVDIPVTAVCAGWTLFAFSKIYSKDPTPDGKILALRESDINGFDRWAVRPY